MLQITRDAFISSALFTRTGEDLHDFDVFADRAPVSDVCAGHLVAQLTASPDRV
jgi:hypothetical protein